MDLAQRRPSACFLSKFFQWTLAASLLSGCSSSQNIFGTMGDPLPNISADQLDSFNRGKEVFKRQLTPEMGMGPNFNVTSCGACHEKPTIGGSSGRYRNFLIVGRQDDISGFNLLGVNGVQDHYTLDASTRVPTDPNVNVTATRHPIPFFGVGLINEIPDTEILKNADPDDRNHDGIKGRPNHVTGILSRFGRKAQTNSIEGFIRGPLFNHAGITTLPLSISDKASLPTQTPVTAMLRTKILFDAFLSGSFFSAWAQGVPAPANTHDSDAIPDPELSEQDLFDLLSFSMLLAAPKPDEPTAQTYAGEAMFKKIGCASCHVPYLRSKRGPIPLFSDLLIHDMGPTLADGVIMSEAGPSDFRTQPLWGVAATGPYLHDGRADTLEEAIQDHDGEAKSARDKFVALSSNDRGNLIAFLESLGGKSQKTDGLLPPGAPIPASAEFGGARTGLSSDDLSRFDRGRTIFDRDFALTAGLGPKFNGDSCRACHFQPVIGGSGPMDVNVIRQGIVNGSGIFTSPAVGTMAHKISATVGVRPEVDPSANVFEARQTPPLFGLGLINEIPDATILSHQDPTDADVDGIKGRANVLADGRLGRFGWKANVPSLEEFGRDAMTNEMGITVPSSSTLTFGKSSDDDSAADPEINATDLSDLVFFMSQLGPPPRTSTDAAAENAGALVFTTVGCAKCHIPSMKTATDVDVPLFSDLLLHDVAPADFKGIEDGTVTEREFRTPPLWGLAKSGPYMHDGRSTTVEDAINRHEGESAQVITDFKALSDADRTPLLQFLRSL